VFLSPWILRRIIQHLQLARQDPSAPNVLRDGLLLAGSLMLVYSLQSLFFNHYFGNNVDVQVQVAGALVTAVYAKSCKLSSDARAKFTSGSISNLMATDARVLADLTLYLNTLWSGVEQIFVALAMLIGLLGWFPTLSGVMVVVCSIPVQGRLVGIVKYTRERASAWTDERVKIVSEAISGIRVVKLYAWESSFLKRILEVRLGELKLVRHALLVQALSSSLVSAIPTGLSLATFGTFVLLGGRLDAAFVFHAIALFNVLRPPMLILPNVMINVARGAASASRIEKFLLADELTPLAEGPHAVPPSEFEASGCDVIASNASFAWDPSLAKTVGPTLSNVDIQIPRGSLVCILGQTASGKSTFLEALLGEVPILSGHAGIRPDAKVAFCHPKWDSAGQYLVRTGV
jgi:ATP-binding cassette, subfamily C (CFTR/MRP), member 1